jgi:hypothetical protein
MTRTGLFDRYQTDLSHKLLLGGAAASVAKVFYR